MDHRPDRISLLFVISMVLLAASPLLAQSGGDFAIVRATIDGGGSTERSPDPILLRGTIGQPDAGASYKGIYYLKSGFWSTQGRLGIFFIDGFESGDTSSWSEVAGGSFSPSPPGADSPVETEKSAAVEARRSETTSLPPATN